MNSLLRRSGALRSLVSHRAIATSSCVFVSPAVLSTATNPISRYCERQFHSNASLLGFRKTGIARVHVAVESRYDDAKKEDEGLEIAKLGISQEIVSSLARRGITKLFPIQRAVLEPAMQGKDMIGRAKTGTGKTLAFGIPIMDKIIRFNAKHGIGVTPLAIVLTPTRELAKQVDKEFSESCSSLKTVCVYGGVPISSHMRILHSGVDLVVGTPGRVIDLLKRGSLDLRDVRFAVLDEADQMLNVGFEKDVEIIMQKLPQKRQTLMFSATMPNWIRKISDNYLNDPVTIDLVGDSDQKLAEGISIYSIVSDNYGKPTILGPLINEHAKGGKCIIFTQTKRDADRLSYTMSRVFACEALHGDISQSQRERTLSGFRDGRFNILIATDVAARGLDIPNVDLVLHYELPNTSELFVHRSGRTGRAGKKGSTILIYTHDQIRDVKVIERDVKCRFIELPAVQVDEKDRSLLETSNQGRYDSSGIGRQRGSTFGRGNFGSSTYSGSRGGFGGFSGRRGSFGDGGSSFADTFGGFNKSNSGRSDGFRDSNFGYGGSGRSTSRNSSAFGESGFGRRFGESNGTESGRFGSFGGANSWRSDSFGDASRRSGSDSRRSSFDD